MGEPLTLGETWASVVAAAGAAAIAAAAGAVVLEATALLAAAEVLVASVEVVVVVLVQVEELQARLAVAVAGTEVLAVEEGAEGLAAEVAVQVMA